MKPSWPSTVIASLLIGLAGAVFLVVYLKGDIDDALKAWAAIGTIGGVITGVVPAYFFGQQRAVAAEESAQRAHEQLAAERKRRDRAEEKAQLFLAQADPQVFQSLQRSYPDLFRSAA